MHSVSPNIQYPLNAYKGVMGKAVRHMRMSERAMLIRYRQVFSQICEDL